MSTIEEELRLLAEVAKPLQKATDEANAAIQAANAGIAAVAPGIEVWLTSESGQRVVIRDLFVCGHCLGVSKAKGVWQTVIRPCDLEQQGEAGEWQAEPTPLIEASREDRLAAAPVLPSLIRAVTEECNRLLNVFLQAAERPL
ncbi:MAG: hypothetical protein JNM69_42870 [Archangium sp.]|nr:hypothetical protein [Archangium sp.]